MANTKTDDELRSRFWDVICTEVDIRIGTYRIGTMENGKVRVWFALRDGNLSPDGYPFDTRQQAIDYALDNQDADNCAFHLWHPGREGRYE